MSTPRQAARGRRPGTPDTREEILGAARDLFAASGFAATSMRAIAARAGVDPSLVHHYFDSKADLFVSALQVRVDPRQALLPVIEAGPDGAGSGCSGCCSRSGATRSRERRSSAWCGGSSSPPAPRWCATRCSDWCWDRSGTGSGSTSRSAGWPWSPASWPGIILLRYVVEAPPLVAMTDDELVASYAPTIQRYLTGPLPDRPLTRAAPEP